MIFIELRIFFTFCQVQKCAPIFRSLKRKRLDTISASTYAAAFDTKLLYVLCLFNFPLIFYFINVRFWQIMHACILPFVSICWIEFDWCFKNTFHYKTYINGLHALNIITCLDFITNLYVKWSILVSAAYIYIHICNVCTKNNYVPRKFFVTSGPKNTPMPRVEGW